MTQLAPTPTPTAPPRWVPPSPLDVARSGWRRLLKMRTAIILLLVLAAGAAVGSLIPQRPVNILAVNRWIDRYPGAAPWAERFGLFDVFGSWWFMAIYALLIVSLTGCLTRRYRAFWRAARARPRARGSLDGAGPYHAGVVALPPERALAGAERVLHRRRFRITRSDGQVAAEKGHLREGGSLLFHTAFLFLLLGLSLGKGFGFSGQVAVIEGSGFTETHIAYDAIREGRFFNEHHRGFRIALDRFDVGWFPNGVPRDFTSHVRVLEGDRVVRRAAIRVNAPLDYRGVRLYQVAWGWAPEIRVTQHGRVLADGPVVFLEDAKSGAFRGVVKAPGAEASQLGLELWLYNDLGLSGDLPFNRSPEPRRPVIFLQSWRGDLRLDRPQSVYELDPVGLVKGSAGAVEMGETATVEDGIVVSFPSLRRYSVFQVARDPGVPLALAAAIMILAGLIPALYSSRRRVWVRAAPAPDGVRVEVAGLALQRKAAFEEEFEALVRELSEDLREGAAKP